MGSILCADIGTTSLKIGIVDSFGEVVSSCIQTFNTNKIDSSFIANEWFNAFIRGAEDCIDACEYVKDFEIDAICISANGPTIVSENGRTLLWNYEKNLEQNLKNLNLQNKNSLDEKSLKNEFLKKSQNINEFLSNLPKTKSLYLPRFALFKYLFKQDYENTKYLFTASEFLIYKLTQKAVSVLPEKRFQDAYWNNQNLIEFGIETSKIPEFVELGFNAGLIKRSIAKKLFVQNSQKKIISKKNQLTEQLWKNKNQKRIPVFCGSADFITALIGTNTLIPGKICDRAGSSEGINVCVKNPVFEEGIRTLPSVIPGLWNISILFEKSGILLDEFKKQMDDLQEGYNSFSEIVDFTFEDKNSQGYLIFTELCKSVKNAVEKLRNICKQNNLDFDEQMCVTGGQAKNDKWLSQKAKNIGIDLCVANHSDAELLGNAVIASVGLGRYKNLQEAANSLIHKKKIFKCKTERLSKLKIYKIPKDVKGLIFDIDSTLYTNASYAFEQVDVQIRHYAKKHNISAVEARNRISQWRKKWSFEHGGKKISLGNTLTAFGVTIQESIKMRQELLHPENFLNRDEKLIQTLKELQKKYKMICVTNNPVLPAKKTLQAIGIEDFFIDVIGLDTCGVSKPAKEPFELACKKLNLSQNQIVSIGDRYDLDLALPLEIGMGAILVGGVEDVYDLQNVLEKN